MIEELTGDAVKDDGEPRFSSVRITLKPVPCHSDRDGDGAWRRLRAALKYLLRGMRLRCTLIEYDAPATKSQEAASINTEVTK